MHHTSYVINVELKPDALSTITLCLCCPPCNLSLLSCRRGQAQLICAGLALHRPILAYCSGGKGAGDIFISLPCVHAARSPTMPSPISLCFPPKTNTYEMGVQISHGANSLSSCSCAGCLSLETIFRTTLLD